MVYVETIMRIMDNSGGYFALCIRILSNSRLGRPGDEVIIAVKSIVLNKKISRRKKRKVLKGTVRKAVLLRCSYNKRRWGNMWVKMSSNAVALIGRWELPVGNRMYGPSFFEARSTKFIRIAMLSEGVF